MNEDSRTHCYVDVDQLYPGDVLLSSSPGLTSRGIRKATRGVYSHAAMHLGSGLLIESTGDDGIAYAKLQLIKAETDRKAGRYRLLATRPDVELLHVYRHQDLIDQPLSLDEQFELQIQLSSGLAEHWGKDYAWLEDLGEASHWLARWPGLRRALLRLAGRLGADKHKVVPGAFCSQLVAQVLTAQDLPPFAQGPEGLAVSPQALADPQRSRLRRQQQIEIGPDASQACDEQRLKNKQLTLDSSIGFAANWYRKGQLRELKALNDVNQSLQSFSQAWQTWAQGQLQRRPRL